MTNESAFSASASHRRPAAPRAPPTSGPAVNPSERTVSISPLARAASVSRPGCGRHEGELGRLADRDAEPEQRHQRQQRPETVETSEHRRHGCRLEE